MPWGVAIGAAGVIGGALISSSAAGDAADQQAQGTADSLAESRRQYDQTRTDYAPYLAAGTKALGTLAAENDIPLDQSQVQLDPGYQFGQRQGQQAIDRQSSAAGGRISGAALKSASQFNTDYATSGYGAAYNRANAARTDRLSRLAALAGIGQTSTNNVSALGANTTASTNALTAAAANNAGSASLAQGNIWGNATNQLAALYGRTSNSNSFTPNATGSGSNPYAGFDASASGGWGIE